MTIKSEDSYILDKSDEFSQCLFCNKQLYYAKINLEYQSAFCDNAWCNHGEFDINYFIRDAPQSNPTTFRGIVIP
jgi:hypothetical protein